MKELSFKMEAAVRRGNATLARNNSATNSNVKSTTITDATGSRQYWDGNGNDYIDSVNHHDNAEGEAREDNRKSSLQNKNDGHRHEIKLSKPEKSLRSRVARGRWLCPRLGVCFSGGSKPLRTIHQPTKASCKPN